MITENSYMDDIPASTSSEEQSVRMTKDIEAILKPRGFRINIYKQQKPHYTEPHGLALVVRRCMCVCMYVCLYVCAPGSHRHVRLNT